MGRGNLAFGSLNRSFAQLLFCISDDSGADPTNLTMPLEDSTGATQSGASFHTNRLYQITHVLFKAAAAAKPHSQSLDLA